MFVTINKQLNACTVFLGGKCKKRAHTYKMTELDEIGHPAGINGASRTTNQQRASR